MIKVNSILNTGSQGSVDEMKAATNPDQQN